MEKKKKEGSVPSSFFLLSLLLLLTRYIAPESNISKLTEGLDRFL